MTKIRLISFILAFSMLFMLLTACVSEKPVVNENPTSDTEATSEIPDTSISDISSEATTEHTTTDLVTTLNENTDFSELTPHELYEMCKNSVVHIETPSGGGSGFFIDETTVITNNHVIDGAFRIIVKTVDGKVFNVIQIIAKSENPDLAILKVDGKGTPFKIASDIANIGEAVYTIGAPLGIFPTFSSGMVQNNTFEELGVGFYLTSIGTISGNSGGPVFNSKGEIIGVVQGGMTDGSNTLDMMIKISHVNDLDRSNPIEVTGKEPLPEDNMEKASSLASANVGELVSFGTYEQDNDESTTNEEILWIVVDKTETEIKLLSLYALDALSMMRPNEPMNWETSLVREFLNNEFFNKAFTASEQQKIKSVTVKNTPNPIHGTDNGNDTIDKVYIFSLEEVVEYYGIDGYNEGVYENIFAHASQLCASKGVWLEDPTSTRCWWWLRSAGGSETNAAEVGSFGYISFNGTNAANPELGGSRGIRPVIHVRLD